VFDVPVDSTYVWFGVGAVSLAVFGVAAGLPSAAPPDARPPQRPQSTPSPSGPPGAVDHHELRADRIRLGSFQVGLDGPGGRAHAIFAYRSPPAVEDSRLERILAGERAPSVFGSAEEFTDAVATVQGGDPDWRPAPDRLTARRVAWRV